jgi:hypothetical protein
LLRFLKARKGPVSTVYECQEEEGRSDNANNRQQPTPSFGDWPVLFRIAEWTEFASNCGIDAGERNDSGDWRINQIILHA